MRDRKRIGRILKLVIGIWFKYPDLRITQLLLNCLKGSDGYYVEDELLEQRLKEYYGANNE